MRAAQRDLLGTKLRAPGFPRWLQEPPRTLAPAYVSSFPFYCPAPALRSGRPKGQDFQIWRAAQSPNLPFPSGLPQSPGRWGMPGGYSRLRLGNGASLRVRPSHCAHMHAIYTGGGSSPKRGWADLGCLAFCFCASCFLLPLPFPSMNCSSFSHQGAHLGNPFATPEVAHRHSDPTCSSLLLLSSRPFLGLPLTTASL